MMDPYAAPFLTGAMATMIPSNGDNHKNGSRPCTALSGVDVADRERRDGSSLGTSWLNSWWKRLDIH
jgi:hypothetical protein